ncbi:hypothetical protein Y032_0008g205 [Ancylostoma ceylanicum]|nr:hypothetical protein Y032_0008g205 [Ancylostoma ceylanicum]
MTFHITAVDELPELHRHDLWSLFNAVNDSSNRYEVVLDKERNATTEARQENEEFLVQEFDLLQSARYQFIPPDNWPELDWKHQFHVEESIASRHDLIWEPLVNFHLFLADKFFTSERAERPTPSLRQSTLHIEGLSSLRRWTRTFTTVVLFMIIPTTVSRSYEVSKEKSCGLKMLMEVMGAGRFDFYMSHVLTTVLCNISVLSIFETLNASYFLYTYDFALMIVVCMLLALSFALLSLLCSIFASSPLTAALVSFLVCISLISLSLITCCVEEKPSWHYIFVINPATAYKMFFESIVTYRARGAGFSEMFGLHYLDIVSPVESVFYLITSCHFMIFFLMVYVLVPIRPCKRTSSKSASTRVFEGVTYEFDNEEEEETWEADIVIEDVCKQWNSKGGATICDINMNAFCGQVIVLFGHSGSGKSSILKMIAGATFATKGSIRIYNVEKRKGVERYLTGIGYTPEGNILFESLTVLDHLWFFYLLKCDQKNWTHWKEEAKSIAALIGLEDYILEPIASLDPSQKRLLAIALSFIGDSPVIILDEPFDDLDASSSIRLKNLLKKEKECRCVIMGTSSAQAAEMVADRIIVLCNGKEVASGTPSSLRKEFGYNYILSVLSASTAIEKAVSHIEKQVRKVMPSAEIIQACGNQIIFGLSSKTHEEHKQLLEELWRGKDALGISDFYIRLCSMVDVYNKIEIRCHETDELDTGVWVETYDTVTSQLPNQILILFMKKVQLSLNRYSVLAQVVVPLLLLLLAGTTILYDQNATAMRRKKLSLDLYDHGRFLIFDPNGMTLQRYRIFEAMSHFTNIEVTWINSSNFCAHWPDDWPYVVGAVALGHDIKYSTFDETRCSMLLGPSEAENEHNSTFMRWSNFNDDVFETVDCDSDKMWIVPDIATYGFPTLTHLITQFYFGNEEQQLTIEMDLHDNRPLLEEITVFAIILSHVFVASFFVTGPLQERLYLFKQQQLSSGLSVFTYWFTCFVFDLFVTLPVLIISLIMLTVVSSKPRYLVVFLMWTYVLARLPMMYFASLFFKNVLQAFLILITFSICYPYFSKMLLNSTVFDQARGVEGYGNL